MEPINIPLCCGAPMTPKERYKGTDGAIYRKYICGNPDCRKTKEVEIYLR
jgi:hypothetical protein